MEDAELIRMANQIADFFGPYTEEEGIAGVANHIMSFWEPRMRQQVLALSKEKGKEFSPLVQKALSRLS